MPGIGRGRRHPQGKGRTWIWQPDCNRNCRRCRGGWAITVTAASPERVVAELTVREDLCTAGDIMHGGAIMAFADTVGAIGTVVNLREGQGTTTVESKTNFFAGSPVGTRLIAEATPLHRGRRTQVWETRITNATGPAGGEGDADADGAVRSCRRSAAEQR